MRYLRTLPVLVLALTLVAIATVTMVETRADDSRRAQLRVSSLSLAMTDLLSAPFRADPTADGPSAPARTRVEIRADEALLSSGLAKGSGADASAGSRAAAVADLSYIDAAVQGIYRIAARPQGVGSAQQVHDQLERLTVGSQRLFVVLKRIDRGDAERAQLARLEAAVGTAVAMLALAGMFLIFYVRSLRARRQTEELLSASRTEATTDALTGLGNRRALTEDLTAAVSSTADRRELLLAMFDLNGFKQYNDTFGHDAGDALLVRVGSRLARAVSVTGSAYRMGGDEFCLMARCTPGAAEALLAAAASALTDSEEGVSIGCSYGAAWIPSEAATASAALRTADRRMYVNKATRSSASRQIADVLL